MPGMAASAVSEKFKGRLRDVYTQLGELERELLGLKDEAHFDQLPVEVVSILARKASALRYMREDLRGIPDRVNPPQQGSRQ
jgi:hypothetical protein